VSSIPTRAAVEARQLEKLQSQVRAALIGERLASFLPIVRELSEEYDAYAIAAAAVQMAYDQTCPVWMQSNSSNTQQERSSRSKPILIKRSQTFVPNNS
jgi:ATP-dependent RNA helicase DeaD